MTRPATDNPAYQKVYLRLHAARPGASQETLHRLTEQFFRGLAARSAATSPAPAASPASPTFYHLSSQPSICPSCAPLERGCFLCFPVSHCNTSKSHSVVSPWS